VFKAPALITRESRKGGLASSHRGSQGDDERRFEIMSSSPPTACFDRTGISGSSFVRGSRRAMASGAISQAGGVHPRLLGTRTGSRDLNQSSRGVCRSRMGNMCRGISRVVGSRTIRSWKNGDRKLILGRGRPVERDIEQLRDRKQKSTSQETRDATRRNDGEPHAPGRKTTTRFSRTSIAVGSP